MGLLALLLLALAGWLILTGRLQRMTMTDGLMLGLAIVGAIMATKGQSLPGGGALALAGLHGWRRLFRSGRDRRAAQGKPSRAPASAPPAPNRQELAEALALLGLNEDADEDAVRAAHRRLIAKNHPDVGGTQALAEKINDARTILLRHLLENKRSHLSPSGSPQEPTGSS
ncbi:MAG: molecular chaperone DnaJ [Sphingobium sp.]